MASPSSRCLLSRPPRCPAWKTGAGSWSSFQSSFQQSGIGFERQRAGATACHYAPGFLLCSLKRSGGPPWGYRQMGSLAGVRVGVLEKGPGAERRAIARQKVVVKALHGTSQPEPEPVDEKGQEGPTSSVLQTQPVAAASSSDSTKQCAQCQRSKLTVDFQSSSSAPDGRHVWCRACVATHHAMQREKCPDHLRLSVEEAWEQRKACNACKQVKEIRDFARWANGKDGLQPRCRACQSDCFRQVVERAPSVIPQVCVTCKHLKAASEFSAQKQRPSGRLSTCKKCRQDYSATRRVKRKESAKIPSSEKRCRKCGVVKQATEFHRNRESADGRNHSCNSCASIYMERWYQKKKMKDKGGEA